MTASERKLTAALLGMAAEEFGNHGCNEFQLGEVMPDVEERRDLMRRYYDYNRSPDYYDPSADYEVVHDYALMMFMAHQLEKAAP